MRSCSPTLYLQRKKLRVRADNKADRGSCKSIELLVSAVILAKAGIRKVLFLKNTGFPDQAGEGQNGTFARASNS